MTPRKRRLGEQLRSLYLWHRYVGLVAALLVVWLSVTGILLNHTEDLRLADRYVQQRWLLSLYNVDAPRDLHGWRVADHWLVETGGRLYLNEDFIGTGQVTGAAETQFGFVVGFRDKLQLFTPEAVLVEEIRFTEFDAPISRLSALPDGGIILTAGGETFRADGSVTHFARTTEPMPDRRQEREALPEELQHRVAEHVLSHTLSWERVMLDVHSGRILGRGGVWLADLAAVLLLLLAVTGVVVWLQRARARRRH